MKKLVLAIALALAAGCAAPPAAQFTWTIPQGVKTVRLPDGYPLAYQEAGSGTPVILVHGAMNDYRVWQSQMPDLSAQFRVISVSLRRYYPEAWDGKGSGFSFYEQADDLAALIRAMNLGAAHVIGHSRGGAVAFHLATRHPELVRSLILADAGGLHHLLPDSPQSRKAEADVNALFDRLRETNQTRGMDAALGEFADTLSGPGTWAMRTAAQKEMSIQNFGTGLAENQRTWPKVRCADVARLTMPVMLVNGERSPARYYEVGDALRACGASNWPSRKVLGTGHSMQRERPAEFNAIVMEFMARN